MPLTALMIVSDADLGAPILGVPLTEFQIRRVVGAGARHIVLLVEHVTAELLAATDRMRRDGIGVDVARTLSDAIDFVHPDDRVMLVGSRVYVDDAALSTLAASPDRLVLSVASGAAPSRLEIIDATQRWTGWAAFNGAELRAIGAIIGDWDLAPTMLRHLLQHGAPMHTIGSESVTLLDMAAERDRLGTALLARGSSLASGAGAHWIGSPIATALSRQAGKNAVRVSWIEGLALASGTAAIIAGLTRFSLISLIICFTALAAAMTATRLNRALNPWAAPHRALDYAMAGCVGVVMLLAGLVATRMTGQWGAGLLGVNVVANLAQLSTFRPSAANSALLADAMSGLVIVALGFLLGAPVLAMGIVVLHGYASIAVGRRDELRAAKA